MGLSISIFVMTAMSITSLRQPKVKRLLMFTPKTASIRLKLKHSISTMTSALIATLRTKPPQSRNTSTRVVGDTATTTTGTTTTDLKATSRATTGMKATTMEMDITAARKTEDSKASVCKQPSFTHYVLLISFSRHDHERWTDYLRIDNLLFGQPWKTPQRYMRRMEPLAPI